MTAEGAYGPDGLPPLPCHRGEPHAGHLHPVGLDQGLWCVGVPATTSDVLRLIELWDFTTEPIYVNGERVVTVAASGCGLLLTTARKDERSAP